MDGGGQAAELEVHEEMRRGIARQVLIRSVPLQRGLLAWGENAPLRLPAVSSVWF
jgi:hypothetical protein